MLRRRGLHWVISSKCRHIAETAIPLAAVEARSTPPSTAASAAPVEVSPQLFISPEGPQSYEALRRRADANVVSLDRLAESPYAPHPAVVLTEAIPRYVAEVGRLEGASDDEVVAWARACCVAAAPGSQTTSTSLAPLTATLTRGVGFRLTRDVAVKVHAAQRTYAETDRAEDYDELQQQRLALHRLEKAILAPPSPSGGGGAPPESLVDVTRRLVHRLDDAAVAPGSGAHCATRCASAAVLGWLSELLQGYLAAVEATGAWEGAVAVLTLSRAVDDMSLELLDAWDASGADELLAKGEKDAITKVIESPDGDAWRRWHFSLLPALRKSVDGMSAGDGVTLARVVAACAPSRNFDLAHQLCQDALATSLTRAARNVPVLSPAQRAAIAATTLTTEVLSGLADCVGAKRHLDGFRELFAASHQEALSHIPVTLPLYNALIHACARCVDEPQRLTLALTFYRALRDNSVVPTEATYAGLVKVAATVGEPTTAFGLFQEAKAVVQHTNETGAPSTAGGVGDDSVVLSPHLYSGLILAYQRGGFPGDAYRTLEVLMRQRVPLTRDAFHAGMEACSYDEAADALAVMTGPHYRMLPTPTTYAHLQRAMARAYRARTSDRLLVVGDIHAKVAALVALTARSEAAVAAPLLLDTADGGDDGETATAAAEGGAGSQSTDVVLTATAGSFGRQPSSSSSLSVPSTSAAREDASVPGGLSVTSPAAPAAVGSRDLRLALRRQRDYVLATEEAVLKATVPLTTAVVLAAGGAVGRASSTASATRLDEETWREVQLASHILPAVRAVQDGMAHADAEGGIFAEVGLASGLPLDRCVTLAPQYPTRLPPAPMVAVIARDVLCDDVFAALEPVRDHFSAVYLPYSSLRALVRFVDANLHIDTLEQEKRTQRRSHLRGAGNGASGSVSAEHDDPHAKAARAVHSLRRLMNCYGDVVHVGSVTEDVTAKVFWRRFGLNQAASQSAPQPRGGSGGVKVVERTNRDVKNLPAEDRHLLAAAAMLVHGNVLDDVCTAAGALVSAGVLEPGNEFVRHGGSFGVYHAVGAKVTVVTRDRRLADRARALGAAAAAVNGGRVSPPAALSAAAAAPPLVSNPFALSALAAAARQPHASHPQPRGRSPRQPRAARLEAHHPDHWPGWLLTAEQRQGM
jgi:hypothetical protein